MKASKLARAHTKSSGGFGKPVFPALVDFVVPDVRRIADEEGWAICWTERDPAVIF